VLAHLEITRRDLLDQEAIETEPGVSFVHRFGLRRVNAYNGCLPDQRELPSVAAEQAGQCGQVGENILFESGLLSGDGRRLHQELLGLPKVTLASILAEYL
jgi:hypothetical protein